MMEKIPNQGNLSFTRYPATTNRSLRAWSSADEYLLRGFREVTPAPQRIAICNDTFGFLSCHLHRFNPYCIIERKSQQKAIEMNLQANNMEFSPDQWISPLVSLPEKIDTALIRIPKSADLFRLYLNQIAAHLSNQGVVLCAFMTHHFTPQLLSAARDYFEEVEQSLAWKKSRLLTLRKRKPQADKSFVNTIPYSFPEGVNQDLKQYSGVFSSGNIDYATQFFITHVDILHNEETILDLGAGNGVIARSIQLRKPDAVLHLIDDSILAVESSKMNLEPDHTHFHWDDTLKELQGDRFDLVVSNPPCHFGHEVNIEITVHLFREVAGVLKPGGRFVCVANRHLGYRTHLRKFFRAFEIVTENDKYIIYSCIK